MRIMIFFCFLCFSATVKGAGYYGVFGNNVFVTINGQTFQLNGQALIVSGNAPYILQAVYVQTEKWVSGGGVSNVCGGNFGFSIGGGNTGNGTLAYNGNFTPYMVGNNLIQEWAATGLNYNLGVNDNQLNFTLNLAIIGDTNSSDLCRETKAFTFSSLLPLSILNIKAESSVRGNVLSWQYMDIPAVHSFEVFASVDGMIWVSRTKLLMDNFDERNVEKSVSHLDFSSGYRAINYYQILQKNANGDEFYSPIVVVKRSDETKLANLYPNPVSEGYVTMQFDGNKSISGEFMISSMTGQVVSHYTIPLFDGNNNIPYEVNDLAKGMYLLEIKAEGKSLFKKGLVKL